MRKLLEDTSASAAAMRSPESGGRAPKATMDPSASSDVERLLDLLDVRLDAFAVCEIESGYSLRCGPLDAVVIHFVLQGNGCVESEYGTVPLRPGAVVVVPKLLAKQISGSGPAHTVVDADDACPLVDGLIRFVAWKRRPDLLLACASVTAQVTGGSSLFDRLEQPLLERATSGPLPALFAAMLRELSRPTVGTRAIVETLMKQILIVVLRAHISRCGSTSPFDMPSINPKLARARAAIVARPGERFTIESLAAIAGMSRSRFAHRFALTYKQTPMEFLQSVRLDVAARLLRNSDLPIKAVAAAVGYGSRSHFYRAFRAKFGSGPSGFRHRAAGEITQPRSLAAS